MEYYEVKGWEEEDSRSRIQYACQWRFICEYLSGHVPMKEMAFLV